VVPAPSALSSESLVELVEVVGSALFGAVKTLLSALAVGLVSAALVRSANSVANSEPPPPPWWWWCAAMAALFIAAGVADCCTADDWSTLGEVMFMGLLDQMVPVFSLSACSGRT
jgi:hypothetical protein